MTSPDNVWDEQILWAKSKSYMDRALEEERESWLFPFWASLSLELLARTALSHRSPLLLADTKGGDGRHHLYYALNVPPKIQNYIPQSIISTEVFARCEDLIPEFTGEQRKLCKEMLGLRNAELHSGDAPFHDLDPQTWQPRFYECCTVLLKSFGRKLVDFVGPSEAKAAEKMIKSMNDKAAKQVMADIAVSKKWWASKSSKEKTKAGEIAATTARRSLGHVVKCPACGSNALVRGEEVSVLSTQIEGDYVVSRTVMLPVRFDCAACGLTIRGHNRLHAAGMGSTFTRTDRHSPMDYYGFEDGSSGDDWEPDNNE
jgi:hypothetical protein